MLNVSVHLSDVQEIRTNMTKVDENLITGWIILEREGSSVTLFFRNTKDVERVMEALTMLEIQLINS
jgi:hypothetical protein